MNATKDIDPNRIVGTLYDEYVKAVYDAREELPDWQEVQIQGAFYAGAHGLISWLGNASKEGYMGTERWINELEAIYDELDNQQKIIVKRMLKYWEDQNG